MKEILTIRSAVPEDLDELIRLCAEHAQFEHAEYDPSNKKALLSRSLFQDEDIVQCLIAEQGNRIIGYATFMKQFSTWDAGYYIYLDCLYFKEDARGHGAGREMMKRVKDYAVSQRCTLIQWQTPSSNAGAIAFYNKIGATSKGKKRFFWDV